MAVPADENDAPEDMVSAGTVLVVLAGLPAARACASACETADNKLAADEGRDCALFFLKRDLEDVEERTKAIGEGSGDPEGILQLHGRGKEWRRLVRNR